MNTQPYTYVDLMLKYRELLTANPGKALVIGHGRVAMLQGPEGALVWAPRRDDMTVLDQDSMAEFDAADFYDGHWDGETVEETARTVEQPDFVELPIRVRRTYRVIVRYTCTAEFDFTPDGDYPYGERHRVSELALRACVDGVPGEVVSECRSDGYVESCEVLSVDTQPAG